MNERLINLSNQVLGNVVNTANVVNKLASDSGRTLRVRDTLALNALNNIGGYLTKTAAAEEEITQQGSQQPNQQTPQQQQDPNMQQGGMGGQQGMQQGGMGQQSQFMSLEEQFTEFIDMLVQVANLGVGIYQQLSGSGQGPIMQGGNPQQPQQQGQPMQGQPPVAGNPQQQDVNNQQSV